MKIRFFKIFTYVFFFFFSVNHAFSAVDAQKFTQRIEDQFKIDNITDFKAGVPRVEGNNIIIPNISMTLNFKPSLQSLWTLSLGDVRYQNVREDTNGTYIADKMIISYATGTDDIGAYKIGISEWVSSNVHFPKNSEEKFAKMYSSQISIKNVALMKGDTKILTLNDIKDEVTSNPSGDAAHAKIVFTSFSYALPPPKADVQESEKEFYSDLRALNLDKGEGTYALDIDQDLNSGTLSINDASIFIKNFGKFSLAFTLNGLDRNFLHKMESTKPDGEGAPATIDAIDTLVNTLKISKLKLLYDNDNFVNRLLAYIGKSKGLSLEETKNMAKAGLTMGKVKAQEYFKNTIFIDKIATEVSKFLDDPKSFIISSNPEPPLAFDELAMEGLLNPLSLIQKLNLNFKAN
ncbi:hypothetical protein [Bartonella sp. DGB2]|uniref:hypothetical protein n=1 Tax=Bartonella sp. DGB2 TaxID=3388426 RepID=UPI00398F8F82